MAMVELQHGGEMTISAMGFEEFFASALGDVGPGRPLPWTRLSGSSEKTLKSAPKVADGLVR
jgi:hypothetical protein